jgi:ribonuclease HI
LAYCKDISLTRSNGKVVAIYSDSKIAMSWVKQGICKSKFRATHLERAVRNAVKRAEEWLAKNGIPFQLLKWKTSEWGEIPADFGRK